MSSLVQFLTVAIHTNSRITLEAIANPRNHQNLVEHIRKEIRILEKDNWIVHFTWVKVHDNNYGKELVVPVSLILGCVFFNQSVPMNLCEGVLAPSVWM
jgi:hypothetical protein